MLIISTLRKWLPLVDILRDFEPQRDFIYFKYRIAFAVTEGRIPVWKDVLPSLMTGKFIRADSADHVPVR